MAKIEICRRISIFVTFVQFCIGIALICAAFGTQQWFVAFPVRDESFTDTAPLVPTPLTTNQDVDSRVQGGMFFGSRQLNYGLGTRYEEYSVYEEIHRGVSFMSIGVWLAIILTAAIAVLWSVTGVIFSLANTVVKPAETITGPIGLFIWSGAALCFSVISVMFFIVQYFTAMQQSVLLPSQETEGFTTEHRISLGYSFWMMLGAVVDFALIFALLTCTTMTIRQHDKKHSKGIPLDGAVLMY